MAFLQKRILLTGSNGLLGQKVVDLLSERLGVQLLATSRGANRHPRRKGYRYQSADLTVEEGWAEIFEKLQPTEVIHTAAMTQVDACEKDHDACDAMNFKSVERLVRLCEAYGSRLIHISTDFIFDGENGPYRESDQPNPVNYYGESKLRAEQHIRESGIPHTILRTILLYGTASALSRSNVVLWAKKSLEAGMNIKVVNDQWRCPTLAEDLATAVVSAAMREANGVFHISGPEFMSIFELVQRVADFWDLDKSLITEIDSQSLNQAACRPPRTGFIILKAQTELGYQPHNLRQGLEMLDMQLKEGIEA